MDTGFDSRVLIVVEVKNSFIDRLQSALYIEKLVQFISFSNQNNFFIESVIFIMVYQIIWVLNKKIN